MKLGVSGYQSESNEAKVNMDSVELGQLERTVWQEESFRSRNS